MSFLNGFEKTAFTAIDPFSAGALGGLIMGHHTGKSMAGTTSSAISSHGYKTKNEELSRNVAKVTGTLGALAGLAAGLKHKHALVAKTHRILGNHPEMLPILQAAVPATSALAGGALAGSATGGLIGLRGKFSKKRETEK